METFPDTSWGRRDSWVSQQVVKFAATKTGSATVRALAPLDTWLLRRTKGKLTALGPVGAPVMLLTATGARSGQPRQSPLLYGRDGDTLIVVGSNFGQAKHPAWSANLLAHPEAVVTLGGRDIPVRATRLEGADAERGYQLMVDTVSTYAAYKDRTDRDIRVFRLRAR
jgi:deazaflavin-dependent oxidoreductase (nitroreductase family)